jgi:hypothetical protein
MLDQSVATGREQAPHESTGAGLAHVLRLDVAGRASHPHLDLVALATAEQASMQERRVRHVESILDGRVQGPWRLDLTHHERVLRQGLETDPKRLSLRLFVERSEDPNQTLSLAHRDARTAPLSRRAALDQSRHAAALPAAVELPAMVGALKLTGLRHPT